MIQALLDGKKTQTRRIIKNMPTMPEQGNPYFDAYCSSEKTANNPRGMGEWWNWWLQDGRMSTPQIKCPYGKIGDRLWVRETFVTTNISWSPEDKGRDIVFYKADDSTLANKWQSPLFMPRKYSRITLEITNIRVERVKEITEQDAKEEGVTPSVSDNDCFNTQYRAGYMALWESINGEGSWQQNPFIWVIEFKRVDNL